MLRRLAFAYSLLAYAGFGFSLLWLLAFLVDATLLPVTVNERPTAPSWLAAGLDLALIAAFGLQHSVMARPGFKRRWVRLVPQAIERSTYVLISSVVTILVCWWWQPLPAVIWSVESTLARTLWWAGFGAGLLVLFGASFHIDHFELLGLRQTWSALRGRRLVSSPFMIRGLYRLVRHPIYVGWLLIFWCTPHLSVGRLLLASGMTLYVLVALAFEERDLITAHGNDYLAYRKAVPALLPRPVRRDRRGRAMAGEMSR